MTLFHRRDLLKQGSLAFGALGASLVPSVPLFAQAVDQCQVRTPLGRARGIRAGGADSYLGLPYGEGVSGAKRFLAATPVKPWRGIYDATHLRPGSMQRAFKSWAPGEPPNAEECLFLNVWTPSDPKPGRPVMIYSHGGGVTLGSSGTIYTNGANLAAHQDVVVVSTNHRLGLLGFLYLDGLGGEEYAGSGNRCLTDIALALEWVQRNIEAFGGDPGNVTIFGESGGGLKTSCLYAMPAAAKGFHKASIESGPGIRLMEPAAAQDSTDRVLRYLGLDRSTWRELAGIPPQRILDAQEQLAKDTADMSPFLGARGIASVGLGGIGPVRDGHVFTAHPFDPAAPDISRDKPLITGGNAEEETSFAFMRGDIDAFRLDEAGLLDRARKEVRDAAPDLIAAYRKDRPGATPSQIYIAFRSALFSGTGARVIAERKVAQGGAPVYLYNLTYARGDAVPGTSYPFGALHGLDMPIKFDNPDPPPADAGLDPLAGLRPERTAMCRTMSTLWANFARTGKPSAPGQPDWPAYSADGRAVMCIDVACRVEKDPDPAARAFWDGYASPSKGQS
jgi:para-nitrobenzyl esterase